VRLYQAKNPSFVWTGEFYLRDCDFVTTCRGQPWMLPLELMQVNTLDGRVLVEDQPVNPPFLPTEDLTSIWVTVQFEVPARLLHAGHNTVTVLAGDAIPALHQLGSWDDFHLRNVMLHKPGWASLSNR
jgi:hypothetical protein